MWVRWLVFAKIWTAEFVFIAVKSKFQRHKDLKFCTENDFIRCLSSCIIDTSIVNKSKFRCQGRPIVSSVIRKVPPITGFVLILGFNLAISPRRVCCLGPQSDSQFFGPVYEFSVNKGSTSVVLDGLGDSKRMDPFLDSINSSLSTSANNWVYHQETRKCINYQ